jgi:hypothetical protein
MAFWLYRSALGLAYFNDDPTGHFAWMEGRTVVDFFRGSAAYGYYRPVVFAVLRLFQTLFGGGAWPHNPFADHTLLVLLHATNAALVWGLAWRLAGPRPGRAAFAWVAALVFAALPFSYEAVAYVASLTHPLVTFFVLTALLLYSRQPTADRRPLTADHRRQTTDGRPTTNDQRPTTTDLLSTDLLSTDLLKTVPLVPFFLALLTHENGLLALPALVGVDWLRRPGDGPVARLRRLWPYGLAAALFVALWLAIPKNSAQGLNPPGDIARNAVPFLQTLLFPLLPLLRLDAGDVGLLAALAVAAVGVLGLLAWRAGAGRLWLFASGWVALAALPSLLFLGPAYVYGSPRLSYLPAVGVGLLWALPALVVARGKRSGTTDYTDFTDSEKEFVESVVSSLLLLGYLLALLWPARPFVACQLEFYAETSRLARAMGDIGHAAPPGREIMFVNAPFFFSSTPARPDGCPSPYPWTPSGGILIPPYAQPRDFVRFNGGPDRAVAGVSFPGYAPGWRAFGPPIDGEALRTATAGSAVYVFDLGRGGFTDLSALWRPGGAGDGPALAAFGGALELVAATAATAGATLDVRLDWRVLTAPPFLPAIFVHVYDATGALVAQSDGPPAAGFAPVDLWRPGDGLGDERAIDLSALPTGGYAIAVGVYNPADGARLAAEVNGARPAGDVITVATIER